MRSIGEQVKALRKERGWTQEELAAKADLTLRTVSRIESGRSIPQDETLKRLGVALVGDARRWDVTVGIRTDSGAVVCIPRALKRGRPRPASVDPASRRALLKGEMD